MSATIATIVLAFVLAEVVRSLIENRRIVGTIEEFKQTMKQAGEEIGSLRTVSKAVHGLLEERSADLAELENEIDQRELERQFVSDRIAECRQEAITQGLVGTRLHCLLCSTGMTSEDNDYLPFGESSEDEVPAYLDNSGRI